MTITYDTTTQQDADLDTLRKAHKRATGEDLTSRQWAKRLFDEAMSRAATDAAILEKDNLRDAYRTATPEQRAAVDAALGR
jgi:hypothetical protein